MEVVEPTGRVVQHAGIIDLAAAGTIVGALIDHVPAFAAGLGLIWYAVQLWESATVGKVRKAIRKVLLRRGPF